VTHGVILLVWGWGEACAGGDYQYSSMHDWGYDILQLLMVATLKIQIKNQCYKDIQLVVIYRSSPPLLLTLECFSCATDVGRKVRIKHTHFALGNVTGEQSDASVCDPKAKLRFGRMEFLGWGVNCPYCTTVPPILDTMDFFTPRKGKITPSHILIVLPSA
jgi:hypothetical protein